MTSRCSENSHRDRHRNRHRGLLQPFGSLADGGFAAAQTAAFLAVRPLLLGRRRSVRTSNGALDLTVTRLSLGRKRALRVTAEDISWRGQSFPRASVVLHGAHLRGSSWRCELISAPVEFTVEVPAPALAALFGGSAPRLAAEVGSDGVARVHLARHRGSGHVEVDTHLDGATLVVTPRAVGLRRTRVGLPVGTPSYRIRLPELPHGLELTAVAFAPGVVRLTGVLPQWRVDIPPPWVDDLLGRLGAAGRRAAGHRS